MGRVIVVDENDLKRIIREVLDERKVPVSDLLNNVEQMGDPLITSLDGIASVFNCSLPKAQGIKNSIPKDQYMQHGRIFAIRRSVLLKSYTDLHKSK